MKDSLILCLILISTINFSCKTRQSNVVAPEGRLPVFFIDSTNAANAILNDTGDNFFESISESDISIQMKRSEKFLSKNEAKDAYKKFLQSEVTDFNEKEKFFLLTVFDSALVKINKINTHLINNEIGLVKIKTNHYGKDVYYTRARNIFIPDDIFNKSNLEEQLPVMIHEIWHIISRENKELREKSYALIGFFPHGKKIVFPSILKDRLLLNPDGVSTDYAIKLGKQYALPLISSNESNFKMEKPSFFDYLRFDLYPIDETGNILLDKNGNTKLDAFANAEFFEKIKDNTQYIIHPDEILADNFMLAVLAYNKNDYSKFSPQGKKLILELINVLKEQSQ